MVGKLRFRLAKRRARRGLPHDAYTEGGARFLKVNEHLRYVVPVPQADVLDAIRRNHELVRRVAAEVDSETFVVDVPADRGVVLGVGTAGIGPLVEGLARLASTQPLYLRAWSLTGRRSAGLAVEKLPLERDELLGLERLEVFQHYREPRTGQSFGSPFACRVEVWREDATGQLVAPAPNGRLGTIAPERRHERVEIDVHGVRAPTLGPLTDRTVLEVDFPIDVVYLWVDGNDPAWQERKRTRLAEMTGTPPDEDSLRSVRFDQGDELRFSVRSLHRYAPWVRRIFVVTDGQRPSWLVERPGRLDVVDHRDFLPPEALPTFNSHAITAGLHRIDGLAERFLVVNDDVLLGRPVAPETFFLSNGVARFFPSRAALPAGPPTPTDPPLVVARKRSQRLIAERTGLVPTFGFKHTPIALVRSRAQALEEEVPDWRHTMHSPFRAGSDIVPEWLHHWLGYAEGWTLPGELDYAYFDIGSELAIRKLRATVHRSRRPQVLCVNDVTEASPRGADRHENLNVTLRQLLPHPSPYEVSEPGTPGRGSSPSARG